MDWRYSIRLLLRNNLLKCCINPPSAQCGAVGVIQDLKTLKGVCRSEQSVGCAQWPNIVLPCGNVQKYISLTRCFQCELWIVTPHSETLWHCVILCHGMTLLWEGTEREGRNASKSLGLSRPSPPPLSSSARSTDIDDWSPRKLRACVCS